MWLRTATGFTAHIQPREPARAAPLCSNVARALEGAAVRLQYEAPDEIRSLRRSLTFYLQIAVFSEWSRGDSNS
jgi:hypothetical protein